jgi:hypothetical protein
MSTEASDYNLNTISISSCNAIKEMYRLVFPDMSEDLSSNFARIGEFVIEGKKHLALFIFGNTVYIDPQSGKYVIRALKSIEDFGNEIKVEEIGQYTSLKQVIQVIAQRQLNIRLHIYFTNEYDNEGNEIPFSSRYECALRGKKFSEYTEEDDDYDDDEDDEDDDDIDWDYEDDDEDEDEEEYK